MNREKTITTQGTLFALALGMIALWTVDPVMGVEVGIYESGVVAASGNGGAADPGSQGWVFSGSGNNFASGFDSGDGGWRTVDGTSTAPAFYQKNLTAQQATVLDNKDWRLDFTLAMDSDAVGSPVGFVDDYYLPPNQGRQNDIVAWIETVAQRYTLTFNINNLGDLFANDGTTNHQLTTDGSAYDSFKSMSIFYNGAATLNFDGQMFALSTLATTGSNRLVFGASSSSGQGSAIWNRFALVQVIPEPTTAALGLIGMAGLLARRRRAA